MTPHFALFDSVRWWANLSTAQQLFYGIGIVAGIASVIMALLSLVGLGHHDLPDLSDHGGGSSILSTKPITAFLLGFGWSGGIALDSGLSLLVATLIGVAVGGILMVGFAAAIRAVYSLRTDGTRRISDAVGAVGTVYVTLPPARAAGGQINVTINGRLETLSALSVANRAVPSGEKIRVVSVIDTGTVLVEPLA